MRYGQEQLKILTLMSVFLLPAFAYSQSSEVFTSFYEDFRNPAKKAAVIKKVRSYPDTVRKNALLGLKQNFNEFSKELPQRIDSVSVLTSVIVDQNSVIQDVMLSDEIIKDTKDNSSAFKASISSFNTNQICTSPRQLFIVLLGIDYTFRYYGEDGVLFYDETITLNDCIA